MLSGMTHWIRYHALQTVVAAGIAVSWVALYASEAHLDNLATVTPGMMLRSSQPGGADLDYLQSRFGLGKVLNLRRVVPGVEWYDTEHAWCAEAGVPCEDVPIGFLPTDEQLITLQRSMQQSDGPVLIHCEFGEVRTGKLAAGYRVLVEGVSPERAFAEMARFRYRPGGQEREAVMQWLRSLEARRQGQGLSD